MTYSALIQKLSHDVDGVTHLEEDEAYQLFSAMLDDGVSDLELGAIVTALHIKSESIEELLGLMIDKGAVALNVVPDRNWNVADSKVKTVKVRNLYEIVRLAQERDLPLNVGTEMNNYGLKLVDDFSAVELAPVCQAFLDGAFFIYGHTVAQRALGIGYESDWARSNLATRRERNGFYTELGRRVPPGLAGLRKLQGVAVRSPSDILAAL